MILEIDIVFTFRLNYVIGGCAAGGVFGAWKRNAVLGLVMCGVFCKISYYLETISWD